MIRLSVNMCLQLHGITTQTLVLSYLTSHSADNYIVDLNIQHNNCCWRQTIVTTPAVMIEFCGRTIARSVTPVANRVACRCIIPRYCIIYCISGPPSPSTCCCMFVCVFLGGRTLRQHVLSTQGAPRDCSSCCYRCICRDS